MSKTTTGSYKGNPTISLDSESKYPFTFGVKKAQLIVEHIEAIKAFAAKHGGNGGSNGDSFDKAIEDQQAERIGLRQAA